MSATYWDHRSDPAAMLNDLQEPSPRKLNLYVVRWVLNGPTYLNYFLNRTDWMEGIHNDPSVAENLQQARNYSKPDEAYRSVSGFPSAKLRASILRDIFYNPFLFPPIKQQNGEFCKFEGTMSHGFSPVTAHYTPVNWLSTKVLQLAENIYKNLDFATCPILADALEEAGCDSKTVLSHLRENDKIHVCGCWVIDILLGKE